MPLNQDYKFVSIKWPNEEQLSPMFWNHSESMNNRKQEGLKKTIPPEKFLLSTCESSLQNAHSTPQEVRSPPRKLSKNYPLKIRKNDKTRNFKCLNWLWPYGHLLFLVQRVGGNFYGYFPTCCHCFVSPTDFISCFPSPMTSFFERDFSLSIKL